MARHGLTREELLRGAEKALRSGRTSPQLRPGIRKLRDKLRLSHIHLVPEPFHFERVLSHQYRLKPSNPGTAPIEGASTTARAT